MGNRGVGGWPAVMLAAAAIVVAVAVAIVAFAVVRRQRRIEAQREQASSEHRLLDLIAPDLFEIDLRTPGTEPAITRWQGRDDATRGRSDDPLLDALRSLQRNRLGVAAQSASTSGRLRRVDDVPVEDDGGLRRFDVTVHPLGPGRAAAIAEDATAHHDSVDTIIEQALHDPVTGLPNRAQLEDHVMALLADDRPLPVAAMVIDIERIDEVNETLGHAHGDLFLYEIGRRLADAAPPDSCLTRIAAGRFGLAIPSNSSVEVRAHAERLIDSLIQPVVISDVPVQTGAAVGVAWGPSDGTTAAQLLQRADVAINQRHAAASRVQIYDAEATRPTRAELDLSGQVRRALDQSEFVVRYQPTTSATTGEIVGAEALVRWAHPTRGMLEPGLFLDLVEAVGLGHELTRQVLDTALADCRRWSDAGWDLDISVNVMARDLQHAGATQLFTNAVERAGLDPARLILEVTERQLLEEPERVFGTFSSLAACGIQCSIDDFGTGFSSLSHLRLLPAEELKIDRSFVGRMADQPADRVIVRSLITLAHELGHRVVAEGVEDEWTADELRRLGCDRLQGFLFHQPVSADHFGLMMVRSRQR